MAENRGSLEVWAIWIEEGTPALRTLTFQIELASEGLTEAFAADSRAE